MKNIRIGNDIYIRWSIFTKNGIPYLLDGKNLNLFLSNTLLGEIEIIEFTTEENVVIFTFKGKDQLKAGAYSVTLIENEGQDEMRTIDVCKPFNLVSQCVNNSDDCCEHVEINTLELVSNFDFNTGGSNTDNVVFDSFLSETSENAVQNKVITAKFQEVADSIPSDYVTDTKLTESLKTKQDNLVDGENIATINGKSLLDGGNIEISSGSDGGSSITIDTALSTTSTNAVQNKVIAQAIADAVEQGRLLALRDLYIEAGAEYNDTGDIIKKTAFWGEEVDHLPGHYYLNGLGDITEEQMAYIYRMKDSMTIFLASNDVSRGRFWQDMGDARLRTLFGTNNYGRWLTDKTIGGANPFASMKIEVIKWTNTSGLAISGGAALAMKTSSDAFFQNTTLKVIDRFMPSKDCSFGQVTNLVELRLWATNFNINLSTNRKISKASIIYTIENVLKTTSKSLLITLHSNVYAKCAEGGEWYEEVIATLNKVNGYTDESGEEITGTITGGGSINIVSA